MRHSLSSALKFWLCSLVLCAGCRVELDFKPEEFTGVNGAKAKERLSKSWPEGVNPDDVKAVDFKSQSSRDSYSTWCRIQLTEAAASKWADKEHDLEVAWGRSRADGHTAPEGVNRIIPGPPPLHRQTGTTPYWWSPPEIDFHATEIMLWYTHGRSGVARTTYTRFDESRNTLWIYKCACQHKLLWPRGHLPDGEPIDFSSKTW